MDKSQEQVARELGFPGGSRVSNYENGSSKPGMDDLIAVSKYFGVTIDSLLHVDLSEPVEETASKDPGKKYSGGSSLPLIPIDAMAGIASGDVSVLSLDAERYVIPEFHKKADFLIRISGTSMSPKYFNGDIVACKKIPSETFLQWGKVYVLDTVQGALCKRILPSKKKRHVICRSERSDVYEDFEISWDDVRSLAIVVGTIRLE